MIQSIQIKTLKAQLIFIKFLKNNKILPRKIISNTTPQKYKKLNKIKSSLYKITLFCHLNMSGLKKKQAFKFLALVLEKLLISKQSRKIYKIGPLQKENQKLNHYLSIILSSEKVLVKVDSVLLTWQLIKHQAHYLH